MTNGYEMTPVRSVDIAEKVRILSERTFYRPPPETVTVVETHMSWVFLAGDFTFKMKKAERSAFFDFTTLAGREHNCREELRLNARLAQGIYLDVVPLRLDSTGQLTFEGDGPVIEWLVKMKRLPAERMLDWIIEHGEAKRSAIDAAARHLTSFYKSAERVDQSLDQVWLRFAAEHERDVQLFGNGRFALDHAQTARALQAMKAALRDVRPLLRQRVDQRAYVEGHGDLRPEHICLTPAPVVIDCLEFSRDLRLLDPYDEIAFLGIECARLGAVWIGERFLGICRTELPPAPPPPLIAFYQASRALMRARFALAHLDEANPRTPAKWQPRARHYIALAEAALRHFNGHLTGRRTSSP